MLDRSENTGRTSTRLRAESQLNYAKPLTIYDSAKKPISQTNGRISRTADRVSSEFVSTSSSQRELKPKLTVGRKRSYEFVRPKCELAGKFAVASR